MVNLLLLLLAFQTSFVSAAFEEAEFLKKNSVSIYNKNKTQILQFQQNFLAEHGQYWQALDTFVGGIPQDAPVAATWDDVGVEKAEYSGFSVSVDVYTAPCGKGFVYNSFIHEKNGIWQKSENYGCLDYRSRDWYFISFDDIK